MQRYKELSGLAAEDLLSKEQKIELLTGKYQLSYLIMRELFISPTYLPTVGETFLRHDFDFAEYLTLCLEKSLGAMLTINIWTLTWFGACFGIWYAINLVGSKSLEVLITYYNITFKINRWYCLGF